MMFIMLNFTEEDQSYRNDRVDDGLLRERGDKEIFVKYMPVEPKNFLQVPRPVIVVTHVEKAVVTKVKHLQVTVIAGANDKKENIQNKPEEKAKAQPEQKAIQQQLQQQNQESVKEEIEVNQQKPPEPIIIQN